MQLITDNTSYARDEITPATHYTAFNPDDHNPQLQKLLQQIFSSTRLSHAYKQRSGIFDFLIINKEITSSQFDLLVNYSRQGGESPGTIICFSGSGTGFHGFRQREWIGLSGNLHLSILLKPQKEIKQSQSAFLIMAATAVVATLNSLKHLKNKVTLKWVNDIILKECKVGGVLAQTQVQGGIIEKVILGLGININQFPKYIDDPIVGKATSVNDHIADDKKYVLTDIFWPLLREIEKRYHLILHDCYDELLEEYIRNCPVVEKEIEVYSDPRTGSSNKITSGKVLGINENLELVLEGQDEPVRRGRIIVKS